MGGESYMSYCSDITKNRILECAKGEFLSKGFENAQVAEIAKLAKVTTGAIYRHFKNKEALFFALIEEEYNYTLDVVSDVEKRSEQKTIRIDSDLVDDEVIIENLFLETMLFVDYMYAHFDNFKLIFACSKGSQVENFIEDITERYTAKNITSLCECVLHDIPHDNVSEYIRSIVVFQYYGWKGLMKINNR